jgi:hypothetical protein
VLDRLDTDERAAFIKAMDMLEAEFRTTKTGTVPKTPKVSKAPKTPPGPLVRLTTVAPLPPPDQPGSRGPQLGASVSVG